MGEELRMYRVKLRYHSFSEERHALDRRKILSKKNRHMVETEGRGKIDREQWVKEIEEIAKKYNKMEELKTFINYVVDEVYKYLVAGKENMRYRAYEIYVDREGNVASEN